MRRTSLALAICLSVLGPATYAAEPGSVPVPSGVTALRGCWQGTGAVMDKPVTITLVAQPIVLGAMLVVSAHSTAVADPEDRYSAQLTFGGAQRRAGMNADPVIGFWADSFGGAFAATGNGESVPGGFDITYQYPDSAFLNQWRQTGDRLTWSIIMRAKNGKDTTFARYILDRIPCPAADSPLTPPAPNKR